MMKPRETLDEAIDRVATQLTQSGDAEGVDIRPVWMNPPAHRWMGWRVAAVAAGVAVILLAVAIIRTPGVDERGGEPSIGAAPLIAWSPLRASMSDTRSGGLGEPVRASRMREPAVAARESAPAFGIPFLETPAALAVAAPTTMANIDVDPVAVDALEIVPLSIAAIDHDEARDSKEQ